MYYPVKPNVAVLLAAFDGMKWINEQVVSILDQQHVNVTLFISVDSSNDGTEQWARDLAQKHKNVLMLPYGECFGGAGSNFFRLIRDVDFSGFEAVSFADQDDIWFKDKLARACALLQTGQYDVYSSNVLALWPNGKQVLIDKAQPQKKFDHFFEAAGPGCTYVFNPSSALAFKQFIVELGPRVQIVSLHDWLSYAFCRHQGFRWWIDPQPSMLYRQHGGNQIGTNTGFAAYKKRFRLIAKKRYRQQVSAIIDLVAPSMGARFNRSVFLIRNFGELRRRPRDRFVLLLMVVMRLF